MRNSVVIVGCLGIALAVVLAMLNLRYGNLNQDEGWYLYAAKQVAAGRMPYADFAYTQGPVLPFVYAALYPAVEMGGVAGGRLITTALGLLGALLAAGTAGRMASQNRIATAVAAVVLVGCNVYQSYFTTVVKTYGLCSFFLMAGLFVLTYRKSRLGGAACFFSGALLALAAGTRISAGIVLPVVGIWLIVRSNDADICREDYSSYGQYLGHKLAWVCFGLGGSLVLLLVFSPFFLKCPEQVSFGLFGYHAGREAGGLAQLVMLKAGFVSRFVQAYFLFSIATLYLIFISGRPCPRKQNRPELLLWICGVALSVVHFIAPFPYDDYQTIAFPLFGGALALSLMQKVDDSRIATFLYFLLVASVAGAFSSPINQDWFICGRDRIWWQFKEKSDLIALQKAGAQIRQQLGEDDLLLTQDTYLAIEAGADVPHGMELGPFSYYPDMPREQAEKLNLLNKEMLFETLAAAHAPVAAFSGYGLSIASPQIEELSSKDRNELRSILEMNYKKSAEIERFGQAHTLLEIFKRHSTPSTCHHPFEK